ncbi:MAG: radical SAM protein [Promethearchaeota archaeon]|nr:MAG: radical SAM protein [Candidatus Lokiarchaeota archaeon]
MRVALINPSPILEEKEQFYGQKWPPLGITLIGTILKEQGHIVRLLDQASNGFSFEALLNWIKRFDPEVIGITAFTVGFLSSIKISEMVKRWNPNIKIILGHYHPTICADKILEKYSHIVDYCVKGENEYILSNLINFLENEPKHEPTDILGISYRVNGKIKHNQNCPVNKNLDDLPFPDRSLLKIQYHQNLAGIELMDSKLATTFFTRGCPYGCAYCAVAKFSNNRYRSKSPERLVEEFSYLASQGYSEIAFVDDNFSLNLKNVLKFCRLLRKENLDVNWHAEMRVDNVSREFFEQMAFSGCKSVSFGIESANQRILDYYNKKISPNQSLRAIQIAKKAKIDFVIGLFMVGAPSEKISECQNTIRFALNSGLDFFFLNVVEAWPGIPMWDDLVGQGLIDENKYWENSIRVMDLTHTESQRNIILGLIRQAYRQHISFRNIRFLPSMLLSPYKRKLALNFLVHTKKAMTAIMQFRHLKMSGFGRFTD